MQKIIANLFVGAIATFFVIFGCSPKKNAAQRLSNTELVDLLTELHMAEAAVQHLPATGTIKDSMANLYYNQILEKHQLSREEFEEIMVKIRTEPGTLIKLYDQVIDSLSELEK